MQKKIFFYTCAVLLGICIIVSVLSYFYELSLFKIIVENFSIIIALISLSLAFSSNNKNDKAKEIEYLMNLHEKFINNDSIYDLYKKLDTNQSIDLEKNRYAVIQYLSFFDNVVIMLNYKLVKVKDVDDYFSYYFFVITNNVQIQTYIKKEKDYFPKTYMLYKILFNYRKKHGLELIKNETPLIQ